MRDFPYLAIQGPNRHPTQVVNIYNAPLNAINSGAEVSFHLSLADNHFPSKMILAGDCNLYHSNRNSSCQGLPRTKPEDFIRWLEDNELFILSEVDVLTNNHGNSLLQ